MSKAKLKAFEAEITNQNTGVTENKITFIKGTGNHRQHAEEMIMLQVFDENFLMDDLKEITNKKRLKELM